MHQLTPDHMGFICSFWQMAAQPSAEFDASGKDSVSPFGSFGDFSPMLIISV